MALNVQRGNNHNKRHILSILSVLVLDADGIISRVSALFTRRSYSLLSFVSAESATPGVKRLTIVVDATEESIEQITKQLHKLVQVLKVRRHLEDSSISRALLLVKVAADASNRPQVVESANIFRARGRRRPGIDNHRGHGRAGQAARLARRAGAVWD